MKNKIQFFYISIIFLSLLFSFFLKIDISNGGSSGDLSYHWKYILALNDNLKILLETDHQHKYGYPFHFPLHHIIISRFDYLVSNLENYINFYFVISLFLPCLFYLCLQNRFPEIQTSKKIFLASIIYFLPNYQASAIWGNSHITSLFFFIGSLYFLITLEKKQSTSINLNIFFMVLFMACAAYTRQYYVIFFPFLFVTIIRITKLKNIVFFCLLSLLLSIPGLLMANNNPVLFKGFLYGVTDAKSSTLIVLSIVFVYLSPFFISNYKYNFKKILEIIKNKNLLSYLLAIIIIFFYFTLNFNYKGSLGGGLYFKVSKILIENNILFFFTALLGLLLCFYYFKERVEDILLIIIISISFSSGYMIFQKYFEPMIILCMFLLIKKDFVKRMFNFNYHFIFIYFLSYWLIYYIYSINFFKKIQIVLP
jgi:hypothetical protein